MKRRILAVALVAAVVATLLVLRAQHTSDEA